jgi:hypothetical protein
MCLSTLKNWWLNVSKKWGPWLSKTWGWVSKNWKILTGPAIVWVCVASLLTWLFLITERKQEKALSKIDIVREILETVTALFNAIISFLGAVAGLIASFDAMHERNARISAMDDGKETVVESEKSVANKEVDDGDSRALEQYNTALHIGEDALHGLKHTGFFSFHFTSRSYLDDLSQKLTDIDKFASQYINSTKPTAVATNTSSKPSIMNTAASDGGGQKDDSSSGEDAELATSDGGGQNDDSSSGEDTELGGGGGVPELVNQINKIQLEINGLRRQKWYGEDVTTKLDQKKKDLDDIFKNMTDRQRSKLLKHLN